MVSAPSSDVLAHMPKPVPADVLFSDPSSASLFLSTDWDLSSIESSLSPDPSLDDFFSSTSGSSDLELELDPLQLNPKFMTYIRYQFEHCVNVPAECNSSSPSNTTPHFPYSYKQNCKQHDHSLMIQARRNAQIALKMSPYRKFQERLQTAKRQQMQQKTKRKFSLKNGPMELGAKREGEGRFRGISNSSQSVRRWRMEIAAICYGQKMPKKM